MISSLDTSIVVRLCTGDSPQHVATANTLLTSSKQLAIADAAFIETEHVLHSFYDFDRPRIIESFTYLLGQTKFICDRELLSRALHYYGKYPSESFVDCCLTVQAVLHDQAPLLTFDKSLAKHVPNAVLLT